MVKAALAVVISLFAQGGPTDSFFGGNEEAIVYSYSAEQERKGQIRRVHVAASFASFVEYEKASYAQDRRQCEEMEKRGEVFRVESGTRCRVIRGGGMSVGPIVRTAQEIQLLNGEQKGKRGWIVAKSLRKYSRIRIDPPERYTDDNWDTPRPLALAFQAQDKVVYRELLAAREKAMTASRSKSRGDRQRQVRYQSYRRERQAILARYELDEATVLRILDWGKQGEWPTADARDAARSDP